MEEEERCLRCGYCCLKSAVVIVVDPEKGVIDGNLRAINTEDERCPYLRGDQIGKYSCAVHDREWYTETPCYQYKVHEQRRCRMGEFKLERAKERA